MKKETKLSWADRIKKRNKMGFSLVELIVVIAIMAIMIAVLAPSLLSYVERARAQKDDSAMSEVVNSIQLALADQNVYDEVLCYTCDNIKSCYVDKASPSDSNREETKNYGSTAGTYENGDHYIYNDNERLADESGYVFHGLMRGVTITFEPERSSNKTAFVLYNGYINAAGHATGTGLNYLYGSCPDTETTSADMVAKGYTENMMLLGNMHSFSAPNHNYLYNRIRATVGDRIELTSQTYRNSCYTVFIRMGTTGGNQADKQDAIMVYGQWSGTNLSASEVGQGGGSSAVVPGGGNNENQPEVTKTYQFGDIVEVENNDYAYVYWNYSGYDDFVPGYMKTMLYVQSGVALTKEDVLEMIAQDMAGTTWAELQAQGMTENDLWEAVMPQEDFDAAKTMFPSANGWNVIAKNKTKTSYGEILSEVDGLPAVTLVMTFQNCENLKVAPTIPSSVTSIGDSAFYNCKGLTSITIPDSVTSIGAGTFYGCSGLTSITIPDSVTSIGDYAFEGCSGLTSITIPDSVTSIGGWLFNGCSSLASITIPDSVTSIGDYAFEGCSGLTSITIPNSVKSIGERAFSGCSSLASITIPDSVTSIGNSAFVGCSGLTSITIPDSVTSIGDCAFYNCSGLTSVTLGNSVTSIGQFAFIHCSGLASITFNGTVAQWGEITKGSDWKYNVSAAYVQCSDGQVSLS